MNNLVTLCAVLATAVYFVNAYDFQDSHFNQLLSSDLEDVFDSLNDISPHPRSRRDEDATSIDEKCRRPHRRPKFCCADDTFDLLHEKDRELFRSCFKETLGFGKHEYHQKKFDLFSCEEVEKRKNEMICVQQCVDQKKGLLAEDGIPIIEKVTKQLKESFTKETWVESIADEIVKTCMVEARNATSNQVKQSTEDNKVCNPSGMTLKHCLFKEIQLKCPVDKIKDKITCDKFQKRIQKGFEFNGPPPLPLYDEPEND